MIAILDYAAGNTTSIKNAFDKIGAKSILTSDPEIILKSSHLVIPGVGAFTHAITGLEVDGLKEAVYNFVKKKRPILGICLGYQLMQKVSYEHGKNTGLGIFPGKVKLLETSGRPIPHIGWSKVAIPQELGGHPFIKSITENEYYFAHSFGVKYSSHFIYCGYSEYGGCKFASMTLQDSVIGVQFHPEKSAVNGLLLLKNFKNM